MKILVTGGAGFIGSITCKKLIDKGHEVIVYDSLIKGYEDSVRGKFVKGCLSDYESLDKTFKEHNPEAVIHFAGFIEAGESMQNPYKFFENNVSYGLNLLKSMVNNNIKKIIFSSSAAVYAPNNFSLKEDNPKNPASVYGQTKLIFENILKWYDEIYGMKNICLRYFNAFGSLEELGERHNPETHLIPLTIKTALGQIENIKIFGTDYDTPDGTCVRDYIHVSDIADAHILALENLKDKSKTYNLGTERGISVKKIINSVKEATGKDFKIIETQRRPGDPPVLIADSNKIKNELGWSPKINFKTGLKQTVEYFKRLDN